jgi:hypothetical protein
MKSSKRKKKNKKEPLIKKRSRHPIPLTVRLDVGI